MRPDLVEVVEHGGDRPAFPMPALDQVEEVFAGPPIDRGERLVEQDQVRVLHDQPGKQDALELAGRERLDRPALEPLETDGGERPARRLAHRVVRGSGPTDPPPVPEQHGIENRDREPPLDLGVLRQIGDPTTAEIGPFDDPLCRSHLADDSLQERALSRSVGADDGGQRAARQRPGQVMNGGVALIGQGEVAEDDGAVGGTAHDNAHQIASQRKIAAIAAQASRSGTLCSSRPRCRKPGRGRTLGPEITPAAARCDKLNTARGPRSPAARRQSPALRRADARSRRLRRL